MNTFDIDIFQLIILLGSIQGLGFTTILFLRKRLRTKSNMYLCLTILFIALSNIQHILIDMNYLEADNFIRKLYLPIQWFILPMYYLHVRAIFKKEKLSPINLAYIFFPIAIVFLIHISHYMFISMTISVFEMPDYYTPGILLYSNLISFAFNTVLFYFVHHLLLGIKKEGKQIKERDWYAKITMAFTVIAFIGSIISFLVIIENLHHKMITNTFLLLVSIIGYYLGYVALYKSTSKDKLVAQKKTITSNSLNTFEKISSYIVEEEHYLNHEINLTEISTNFNISSGYLSQLFNTHSEQNFNDYINKLRVEASKKMLLEDEFKNYTIESIGVECGFKSKSNFYAAFKKFTGVTPKVFANK